MSSVCYVSLPLLTPSQAKTLLQRGIAYRSDQSAAAKRAVSDAAADLAAAVCVPVKRVCVFVSVCVCVSVCLCLCLCSMSVSTCRHLTPH